MNIMRFVDGLSRFIVEILTEPSYVNRTGLAGAIISLPSGLMNSCCNLDFDGIIAQNSEPP